MKRITKQQIQEVIDYLESIPHSEWMTGDEVNKVQDGKYQFCYLGQMALNPKSPWVIPDNRHIVNEMYVPEYYGNRNKRIPTKAYELQELSESMFDEYTLVGVNDDRYNIYRLGTTPKRRVINLLKKMQCNLDAYYKKQSVLK